MNILIHEFLYILTCTSEHVHVYTFVHVRTFADIWQYMNMYMLGNEAIMYKHILWSSDHRHVYTLIFIYVYMYFYV